MKRILALSALLLAIAGSARAQSANADLPMATFQYNQQAFPTSTCSPTGYACLGASLATQFIWITSGNKADLSSYESFLKWNGYQDSGGTYVSGVYLYVIDDAATNGWDHEAMMLHATQDYSPQTGDGWFNIDCFDIFEQVAGAAISGNTGTCATAQNGVFLYTGSYTDVTHGIYAGTCGATCTIANSDIMYFGYAEPFDQVNFTLATFQSGGTVTWQYWNGSAWATLAVTDGTSSFTSNGQVYFSPPTDWALTVVNSSHTKFWVRVTVSGSPATPPKITTAKGDNWAATGSYTQRGWKSSTCISGLKTLTYNSTQYCPNPTTTGATPASAKFKYQARYNPYPPSGTSFRNYIYYNPSNVVSGTITAVGSQSARWAAERAYYGNSPNGLMFDNVNGTPAPSTPTWTNGNYTDLACAPSCTSTSWQAYFQTYMTQARTSLEAAYPAMSTVGGNVLNPTAFIPNLDFQVLEQAGSQPYMGDVQFHIVANGTISAYAPGAGNPTNSKLVMALWDNQHFGLALPATDGQGASNHVWSQSDRTVTDLLATYYVINNANTYLSYNDQGYSYFASNELYTWNAGTTTTLAGSGITSGQTCGSTFTVASTAGLTTVGGPEYGSLYVLRIGGADIFGGTFSGSTFTISGGAGCSSGNFGHATQSWSAGTTVEFAQVQYWAATGHPTPTTSNVWYYANWWPIANFDLGVPNTSGWNGGAADLAYLTGNSASTHVGTCGGVGGNWCSPVWRRDYTCPGYGGSCVVFVRSFQSISYPSELETPSPTINLNDPTHKLNGSYYRLHADGSTTGPITTLTLDGGEAAILLTNPGGCSLTFPPPSLPAGQATVAYTATMSATCGVPPYSWSITAGSLPTGLNLGSSTGTISGTPTTPGTSSFTVQVCDSAGTPTCLTQPASITITNAPLLVTTANPLPGATAGSAYSTTLAASGGYPGYTWSTVTAPGCTATLPAGLSLNPTTGQITGTPSAPGVYINCYEVTDTHSQHHITPLALTVGAGAVQHTSLTGEAHMSGNASVK
jgi:Putative Ig domain